MNRPKTPRKQRPRIESLEARQVMATWGVPWADAQHITASFVPDGTSARGQSSALYQTFDSQLGRGNWQAPILKAIQTWAQNSNINVGLVADGGQPLGVAGPAQGDARFGDVRIVAEPLPADVVAITTPYNSAYGTMSGDMIFNSNLDFNPKDAGSYDLYTVALHEAGHIFGFADSSDPANFMYNVYQAPQAGLSAGAVPALQALFGGPRDINGLVHNDVSTDPSHPVTLDSLRTDTSVNQLADLASAGQSDYFALQAPQLIDAPLGVDLRVQTSGISFLTPTLTVRGPDGNIVATATASGPLDGGVSVHLDGLVPGSKFSIQVTGATGDALSTGSYNLTGSITMPSTGQGSHKGPVEPLKQSNHYDGSTPLTVAAGIQGGSSDSGYSFVAPTSLNGVTLNLQEWGVGLAAPQLALYDSLGLLVGKAIAPNAADSNVSLQLPPLIPGATYTVHVLNTGGNAGSFGTYQLAVGFQATTPGSQAGFTPAVPYFGSNKDVGNANASSNSTLSSAVPLQTPDGMAANSRYLAIQGLTLSQSQNFYQIATPQFNKGVMTVSVQALGSDGMQPWISVFDKNGNALNAQVLSEQDGIAVVQVLLPSSIDNLIIGVSSAQVGGAPAQGNYYLDATFGTTLATIGPLSTGNLPPAAAGSPTATVSVSLTTTQGGFTSFVLDGSDANARTDAILTMTLLDASGQVVSTLSADATLARSEIINLPASNYTILIEAKSPSGQAIPSLAYSLSVTGLTDPIKVYSSGGGSGANPGR